jgi:hypothetical protein
MLRKIVTTYESGFAANYTICCSSGYDFLLYYLCRDIDHFFPSLLYSKVEPWLSRLDLPFAESISRLAFLHS